MLMLHRGARAIRREDLTRMSTPEGRGRWRPRPHFQVVEELIRSAWERNLTPTTETYGVRHDTLTLDGRELLIPDANLYGVLTFEADLPGMAGAIAFRHSNAQKFAVEFVSGASVFCCDNGVISGVECTRCKAKHTTGLTLRQLTDQAVDLYLASLDGTRQFARRLERTLLRDDQANHLVVEAAREGAISSSKILTVLDEYHEPKHEEFKSRTAWSLYNAHTEVMKGQSPDRQTVGMRALGRTFNRI